MTNKSISVEELAELEKKYLSPVHIMTVKTDDTDPIYILKGGREDFKKVGAMYNDLYKLIRELRKCVM